MCTSFLVQVTNLLIRHSGILQFILLCSPGQDSRLGSHIRETSTVIATSFLSMLDEIAICINVLGAGHEEGTGRDRPDKGVPGYCSLQGRPLTLVAGDSFGATGLRT